jgi:hypothetical protein
VNTLDLDLMHEEAILLPDRDTLALLNLNFPITVGIAVPTAIAIAVNAATINSNAGAFAMNFLHLSF